LAIVGMGCRFPGGASNPADYWRLLDSGVDATKDVPDDRWDAEAIYDSAPATPGKAYTKRGAFLDAIDGFEPEFFGISPREAIGLDPQQRLLLEVTWEAFEHAGIVPSTLGGSATGVWVGLSLDDYASHSTGSGDLARIDAYSALGNARSVAAGRIAYVLDLHGPVMQVDAACASSLVALHLACQSLRAGECDRAVVAAASLMSSPEATVALCQLRALAPDGRCKTFDSAADGYGRGEGCGVVVLERLEDARATGRTIHAVVRGTAVNHDGRSNGLTAPNGTAQEAVIRAALANGNVPPAAVGYVEAHGTGTLLGDPVEVLALSRVYGPGRAADAPLYLGSVKTNFGHLEAAAGMAGLIKAVLSLSHERIPQHLHLKEPNPRIPWRELAVRVASAPREWEKSAVPRVAGVSAFGISGTNAHVLVEEAPPVERRAAAVERSAELIVISARTDAALRASASRLRDHLKAHPEWTLHDVAYSLLTTRAAMDRRWAFATGSRQALDEALDAAARAPDRPVDPPPASTGPPKTAFVFPGQGSQWLGMGRQLWIEEAAFREALSRCDQAIAAEAGWSVIDELGASADESRLDEIDVVQPVLFAFQVALTAMWRSWGVEPDAVVGHSMGEVAAACVSGALSVQDGAAIVCRRSALLRRIRGRGEMALVELPFGEAAAALAGLADRVDVAASNGTRSTVLSGEPGALTEVLGRLEARGVFCRRIKVDVASHSPQVDPLLPELVAKLRGLSPQPARLAMHSTVTGARVEGPELDASYWADNLRRPVSFATVIEALSAAGFTRFVEMSPHPLLVTSVQEICERAAPSAVAVGSLRRDHPERSTALHALGALFAGGLALDARALFPEGGERVELPVYPWQRQRYWIEAARTRGHGGHRAEHPLLGARVPSAGADAVYDSTISAREPPWVASHRVSGRIVLPGAATAELLRAAIEDHGAGAPPQLTRLTLESPIVVPARRALRLQTVLTANATRVSLYGQGADAAPHEDWTLFATCDVGEPADLPEKVDLSALRGRCPEPVDVEALAASFARVGLGYGPEFRGLRALWRGAGEALAEVRLPEGLDVRGYGLHPALLDAAFQVVGGLVDHADDDVLLPLEIGRFVLRRAGARAAMVHARLLARSTAEGLSADVTLTDASGEVVAQVEALRLRRVPAALLDLTDRPTTTPDSLYRMAWPQARPAPSASKAGADRWVVVAMDDRADGAAVVEELRAAGATSEQVDPGRLRGISAEHVVCAWDPSGDAPAALTATLQGLDVVQALDACPSPPRLWWLTREAVAESPEDDCAAGSSSLWGLGRTAMQERPELRFTMLDLERGARAGEVLIREASADDDESQLAWRKGQRHAARLVRAPAADARYRSENYRLDSLRDGTLDGLHPVPAKRRAPGPREVEIEVSASGLNFRDVLVALGMYPGKDPVPLGGECAGVVARVGAEVRGILRGDCVMALAAGAFARFVTVDARAVAPVPKGLSLQQAAAVPIAFSTAWYALHDLAALEPGERVLIHSAAGGVGMAASQLARWIGAEVLATASPAKWDAVRAQGIRHVASSRDPSFADEFRAAPGRADVILNSLAGEFVDASLSLLSPGGRFIEMGKADIRDPSAVAAAHPGVSYRAFDLTEAGLDRLAQILAAVGDGFASGHLGPLPVRTFAMTQAEEAFRFMAQARHVGKIVVAAARPPLRVEGTVLVTGGLGALGLEAAKGLARRGVRHLLLVGRRGMDAPGAADAVAEVEALGGHVTVAGVDVADREALARVLAEVPARWPLRGVVHAAGVLGDGVLSEQRPDRVARVMAPKAGGAWNLHALTKDADLDFFLLYSSTAGVLGSAGQSGYAAANAYLDALAQHRHAAGLPALSIAWGPWAERGLAASLEERLRARFARYGLRMITPAAGRALFEETVARGEAQLMVAPLDLRALARAYEGAPVPPLWRGLVRASTAALETRAPSNWAEEIELLPSDRRPEAALEVVRAEVARVLSFSGASSVPTARPLKDLGLDSLMGVELRNALRRRTGVLLPAAVLSDNPTARAVAGHLVDAARGVEPRAAKDGPPGALFERLHAARDVRVRLVCFHDAGGSSEMFVPFEPLTSAGVEVHAVSPARHGDAGSGAARYLSEVTAYLRGLSDRPYVLFGHSLGGLYAWRVLEELERLRSPLPAMLMPSACALRWAIDGTFMEGDPAAAFESVFGERASAMQSLRAAFIADVMTWRAMPHGEARAFDVPIAGFAGREDPMADPEAMRSWARGTRRGFSLHTLAGGHFYIFEEHARRLLLEEMARLLSK
jgi:acyl transferase domain-containing protein/NADPH:quinone reductase-like Zn-dependent oxidoreductase/surfactin synthase thioesterase subunit/NAD(P)-dependent dehydrogenase (short-subunit alcohol dehydrogenase family)